MSEQMPGGKNVGWSALLGATLLAACTPAPLTDEQVRMVVQACAAKGMATHVFNSPIVSRADCVAVEHKP